MTNPPKGTNNTELREQLISALGLERSPRDQLVLSNYEDVVSDWQFTVDEIMELFAQHSQVSKKQTVNGYIVCQDGDKWFAAYSDFVNLQESKVAFGDSPKEALQNFFDERGRRYGRN